MLKVMKEEKSASKRNKKISNTSRKKKQGQ
jgi:hypothetical protein